jgi:hypothetical protein
MVFDLFDDESKVQQNALAMSDLGYSSGLTLIMFGSDESRFFLVNLSNLFTDNVNLSSLSES